MRLKNCFLFLFLMIVLNEGASVSYAQEKCTEVYGSGTKQFSLATGSPGELQLLKVLGETFSKETSTTLCWIKTGAAIAAKFIDFVSSERGQKIMRDYGKDLYGKGLYNDAAYAQKYDE